MDKLGVSGTFLYNHVAGKDALVDVIAGLLWEELVGGGQSKGS